jgi:hypothetical protein
MSRDVIRKAACVTQTKKSGERLAISYLNGQVARCDIYKPKNTMLSI